MRRPVTRRARLTALGLELTGAAAVVSAVALWNVAVALGFAGLLLIAVAQLLGEIV